MNAGNRIKKRRLDRDSAETIALEALRFLVSDEGRMGRFLALTGLDAQGLRELAATADGLRAVLDHLVQDESATLMFAAEHGYLPETVVEAQALLSGPVEHWP